MTRLRLVSMTVQAALVAEDGDHLAPVACPPITISAAELDGFPEFFRGLLAEQQAQVNAAAPPPSQDAMGAQVTYQSFQQSPAGVEQGLGGKGADVPALPADQDQGGNPPSDVD